MRYPSVVNPMPSEPEEVEVGVLVVGSVRVRCVLDPDWISVLCMKVEPGQVCDYLSDVP